MVMNFLSDYFILAVRGTQTIPFSVIHITQEVLISTQEPSDSFSNEAQGNASKSSSYTISQ